MNIKFGEYWQKEFRRDSKDSNFRLYHDWIYDQVFGDLALDDVTAKLIRMVLFKSIGSILFASEFSRLEYYRACVDRARAPSGELQGKVISRLENKREFIPLLIPLSRHRDEYISKAAKNKIQSIKLHTDKI